MREFFKFSELPKHVQQRHDDFKFKRGAHAHKKPSHEMCLSVSLSRCVSGDTVDMNLARVLAFRSLGRAYTRVLWLRTDTVFVAKVPLPPPDNEYFTANCMGFRGISDRMAYASSATFKKVFSRDM